MAVTQSIILFLKRYLWINQSWKDALKHSFDLLTLMVVFVYLIYKYIRGIKRMNNNFRRALNVLKREKKYKNIKQYLRVY